MKMRNALSSAIDHLENLKKTPTSRNERELMDLVWKASAETEYALFLFSMLLGNSEAPTEKDDKQMKHCETRTAIISAVGLLLNAKASLDSGELKEAHERTRTARDHLLRVWTELQKKRRK